MGYLELVDKYTSVTREIGYIEDLIKKDEDLALVRKLKQLRREQRDLGKKINEYNGVRDER